MNHRGTCRYCGHHVRLCAHCNQHVFWVQLHDGTPIPVSYHFGTIVCKELVRPRTNTANRTCTDDWCATCGYLNEDARHVYGCDCRCNLYARDT